MKIAWVVAYPVYGGPHNHVQRIAPHLRRLGVETCVVVPDEPGNAFRRLKESADLDVVAVPLHRLRALPRPGPHVDFIRNFEPETRRLARLFRDRGIDVVVQATLLPPHAAVAARRARLPVVCQIVDTRTPRPLATASMVVIRRLADHVMFDGAGLIDWHTNGRPLAVPSEVYFPPVDTAVFTPSPERRKAARAMWGIPTEVPVVGMVANLNPQKGWEYFVRAAAIIHRDVPTARFLMVGATYEVHTRYLDSINDEIAASGVPGDRFIMTGESREVETALAAMDVKLITSVPRSEGTTTTGLEALSCGVPVVGVDVGAVAEWLDGEVGVLVAARDPPAIAAAVVDLLADPERRARMGRHGRQRAVSRFDVCASAKQHHAAFEAALEHHARRRG